MRILAISDEEAKKYFEYYTPGCLDDFDLIISCGDLKREYLQFLVTMAHCPLIYVHGNHDESFSIHPPEGCTCIDDKLVVFNGVRILGLGGSFRYKKGENMYTQWQMRRRVFRLLPKIIRHRGFDILVTHAPPQGLGDLPDLAHRGFRVFVKLLEKYQPSFFLHGHIHPSYDSSLQRVRKYQTTNLVNAFGCFEFDFQDRKSKKVGYRDNV